MTDWLLTIRQATPGLPRLLCSLGPTLQLTHLGELDARLLARERIRGLIWDVDGTLTHAGRTEVAPEASAAIERLHAAPGLRHVILSNGDEARSHALAALFPAIPVLSGFATPGGPVLRRLHGGRHEWSDAAAAAAGPAALRRIRKPSAVLVRFAVRELGLDADGVAMIGDQYLTDVAGANLAGVRSIKVPTLGRSSFPLAVRALMRVDEWLFRVAESTVPEALRIRAPGTAAGGS
jgi:HAD superfamily phosphatase (TIGR01668 family)